jgi:tricorn protease-like protein
MKTHEHRMIYTVNEKQYQQIKELKKEKHLNISSLIRGFLAQTYQELKELNKELK